MKKYFQGQFKFKRRNTAAHSCGPWRSCAWMLLVNAISRHAVIEVKRDEAGGDTPGLR